MDKQYRIVGKGANLREEPYADARVKTVLTPGTIVHADPDATGDGGFLAVIVRGYIHESLLEAIE